MESADLTLSGRLFQSRGALIENAWSSLVFSLVSGTTKRFMIS